MMLLSRGSVEKEEQVEWRKEETLYPQQNMSVSLFIENEPGNISSLDIFKPELCIPISNNQCRCWPPALDGS